MEINVFDYEMPKDEQLLAHAIKYAVTVDDEMAKSFKKVISPILVYANFIAKTMDFRRKIDFPELLKLSGQAVEMCYAELARIHSLQDESVAEIAQSVETVHKIDVKTVLQNAETKFYDFLVDCCV